MIISADEMSITPYKDSRGESGMSGDLFIAQADKIRYLLKCHPVDVANEFVAHSISNKIGVPSTEAILIQDDRNVLVGIKYEDDFKRVPWDDFLGTEEYEDRFPILINGEPYKTPLPATPKYSDDDPLLGELMAYLSFRNLIVIEDNVQLALSNGHLISFDYAESFYLTEESVGALLHNGGFSRQLKLFTDHLLLERGYTHALEFLHRRDNDALLDAYLAPLYAFQDSDFGFIISDLRSVYPAVVPAFYEKCIEIIKREIARLGE